jgi:hypothetical protein
MKKRQKTIAKKSEELTSKPSAVVTESKATEKKEPAKVEKQVVVESKQVEEKVVDAAPKSGMSAFNAIYSEMLKK